MNLMNCFILTTSPTTQLIKKTRKVVSLALRQRSLYGRPRRNNTGKEIDPETGLYYFGARYLDPKTSRWISGDPAVGEYIPVAPVNEEARKRNGSLPGMGGVFNYVNLHVYHYAGNNPVVYRDPDGRTNRPLEDTEDEWGKVKEAIDFVVPHLDTIINELTDYISGASRSISSEIVESASDWLGIDVNSRITAQIFANDLRKIKNKLESLNINNFSWDDNLGDYVARTDPLTEHTRLDPIFPQLSAQGGFLTKFGTLVHEVTHFRSVLYTVDISYNIDTCKMLVRRSPERAYTNACNWEFFINTYVNERLKR